MENPWVVGVATAAFIGLSAFFVAVEFAVIAAKRHRLEDAAATSRSARAALRSASELTLLLAGSQLGITVCTLALGAISKPAVHHWFTPVFEGWGLAAWLADAAGFVLALLVVTFLHLVVGEMAPKSWAIAHPERSATLLALPMRAFMALTRPSLRVLNGMANWCLRRVGVEPADEVASVTDPASLRQLVEHSAAAGTLDPARSTAVVTVLEFTEATVGDVLAPGAPTGVPAHATVADVQAAARVSGHLRILLGDDAVVHVRDTLGLEPGSPARAHARPVPRLDEALPLPDALRRLQERGEQLAVVERADGRRAVVTVTDLVGRLLVPSAA
ncbi:CNNM domain-containing protein [Jatrophihabitans sp. YIM 134969]